jgi:hypothetical protein
MATDRNGRWLARRKRDGNEITLGTHGSREEAEAAEHHFDQEWPPAKVNPKYHAPQEASS